MPKEFGIPAFPFSFFTKKDKISECFSKPKRTMVDRSQSQRKGVNDLNDEKIIQAIQCSDETAMDYAINKYSRLMWSIVSAVLKNTASEQDMEECVADVFIYLWNHPEKFDPRRGKLKVWLSVVARSQALDKYRELARSSAIPLEDTFIADKIGAADRILAQETRHTLIRAINTLHEPDREILIRRYYHEQKPREIAVALDMPVKHVENRLYRAKKKLRELISEEV